MIKVWKDKSFKHFNNAQSYSARDIDFKCFAPLRVTSLFDEAI